MQETFLAEFEKRGYFSQCTDRSALSELMSKGKIKAYIGFDCTAPSLHVGSLMQIMCLRLLQKNFKDIFNSFDIFFYFFSI